MRWFSLVLVLLAGCARHPPARDDRVPSSASAVIPRPKPSSTAPFAVVELFTSEGCSSCPPADEHLADLEANARTHGRNVFPLSFHVDYWNYIGWRDPFSDARYSERQQLYARALGGGQLYTPQIVVNGRAEFTGTARAKVMAAIETSNSLRRWPSRSPRGSWVASSRWPIESRATREARCFTSRSRNLRRRCAFHAVKTPVVLWPIAPWSGLSRAVL